MEPIEYNSFFYIDKLLRFSYTLNGPFYYTVRLITENCLFFGILTIIWVLHDWLLYCFRLRTCYPTNPMLHCYLQRFPLLNKCFKEVDKMQRRFFIKWFSIETVPSETFGNLYFFVIWKHLEGIYYVRSTCKWCKDALSFVNLTKRPFKRIKIFFWTKKSIPYHD